MRALPGPSAPPVVGNIAAFRRDRLGYLTRIAREHGDVADVRLGPRPVVLLSHPDDVAALLSDAAGSVRKGPVLQQARVVLGHGLLTSEGAFHRAQRRLIQPAFGRRALAGATETMARLAAGHAERWRPGHVDAWAAALGLTIAVAGRTLFDAEVDAAADEIAAATEDVVSAYDLALVPGTPWLVRSPLPAARRLRRGRARLQRLIDDMIEQRRRSPRTDLLSSLVATGIDDTQIRDEALTLLLAGHETTASTLAWTLWQLARHPDAQAQVAAEASEWNGEADAELHDAQAAVAEALRLHPPSWAMGREATVDVEVAGVTLHPGDVVLASQWVVHRDPRWWIEPARYDPARWHEGEPRRGAYFPFGMGPRRCIGETFAWKEASLAVAAVLRRWRLGPAAGAPAPRPRPLLTLRPDGPVWVTAQRR